MAINLTVQDGVVKSPALRYDHNSKPELRFTLVQTEKDWPLYLPCTAVGAAAERLASKLEDGQHSVITSGKLAYRKRATKAGKVSRLEILVWAVDQLTALPSDETLPADPAMGMSPAEIVASGGDTEVAPAKKIRPR